MRNFTSLVLVLATLAATAWAQYPQIAENILPVVKKVGTIGELRCVVTMQDKNKVYWIHRETNTPITEDDKVVIDHNEIKDGWPKYSVDQQHLGERTHYVLRIRRLEPRDTGLYTCRIIIRGDQKSPSKDGRLVVLIPPAIIRSHTSTTVTANIGEPAQVTCNATGYPIPKLKWVRTNGRALPSGKFSYYGDILKVKETREEDRGVYRCIADNDVRPPAMHDATLLVFFKPVARAVQDSYGQAQNRRFHLTMECRIAGFPDPELRWYKVVGDKITRITNNEKYEIFKLTNHGSILGVSEVWFQLFVKNVQAGDYGEYLCEGENKLGKDFARIKVYETMYCQGPNCPSDDGSGISSHATIATYSVVAKMATVLLVAYQLLL